MLFAVRVDPARDVTLLILAFVVVHAGSAIPSSSRLVVVAPPAGTADRTLTVLTKAPMRSRPPDRSVRVTGKKLGSTDQRQGTKPVTP
ncbi:MAG: hypothetical protein NVSMB4_16990 [Acidimicrobiales bacterium]